MARTTKASNAVQRLKERAANGTYSMVSQADGRFYLSLSSAAAAPEACCAPLEIDEFVRFVNGVEKGPAKKLSKLDVAFEKKLAISRNPT